MRSILGHASPCPFVLFIRVFNCILFSAKGRVIHVTFFRLLTYSIFVRFSVAFTSAICSDQDRFKGFLTDLTLRVIFRRPFTSGLFKRLLLQFTFNGAFFMTFTMRVTKEIQYVSFIRRMSLTTVLTRFMLYISGSRTTFNDGFHATFRRNRHMFFRRFMFFKDNRAFDRSFFLKSINVIFTSLNFYHQNGSQFKRAFIFARTFQRFCATSFARTTLVDAPYASTRMTTCSRFGEGSLTRRTCNRRQVKDDRFPIQTSINDYVRRFNYSLIRRLSFMESAFQRSCIRYQSAIYYGRRRCVIISIMRVTCFAVVSALLS